jgi:hypothetical protein
MNESKSKAKINEFIASDITSFTSSIVSASRQFDGTRAWWRGQRDDSWNLYPSLYRLGFENKEENLNARFRLMAKVRRGDVPDKNDPLGWLFLMQHYRLPTRLLDWSQSPLVALYFALEKPDDRDAAIWALSPTLLNDLEAQTAAICMPGSEIVGQLGLQAFRKDANSKDTRILSVLTEEADLRHLAQQSAFTVHGRGEPLDQIGSSHSFLVKVKIPANRKEALRQTIALFGISRASLFPDLENLALELAGLDFAEKEAVAELANEFPVDS